MCHVLPPKGLVWKEVEFLYSERVLMKEDEEAVERRVLLGKEVTEDPWE